MSTTMPSMSREAESSEHIGLGTPPDEELGPYRRAEEAQVGAVRTSLEVFKRLTRGYSRRRTLRPLSCAKRHPATRVRHTAVGRRDRVSGPHLHCFSVRTGQDALRTT